MGPYGKHGLGLRPGGLGAAHMASWRILIIFGERYARGATGRKAFESKKSDLGRRVQPARDRPGRRCNTHPVMQGLSD
jgi:hypothetical protein